MAKSSSPRGARSEDPLTRRSFPEVAEALRSQSERIIQDWMAIARRAVASAAMLPDVELRDNLPNILRAMSNALAQSQTEELKKESPAQGISRFAQRYDIADVMTEDRLLRGVILTHIEAELKRRLTQEEQIALDVSTDLMMQQAVIAFVENQNGQLRTAAEVELKYLSFLSHDLHGSLGTVTLWLQVLRTKLLASSPDGEAIEALDVAQEAILNTIGGMGQLLQAERLRKQGVKPAATTIDLKKLINNIAGLFAKRAEQKGLQIVVQVEPDAKIVSDAELITLVLQNLVGNAVKYSNKGTVRVRCGQVRVDGNGDGDGSDGDPSRQWELSVSDEGPGIAAEQLENIFSAFSRGQTYGQSGTGLGLTIASQAAGLLGGELRVESHVGKGSTFTLTFPAALKKSSKR